MSQTVLRYNDLGPATMLAALYNAACPSGTGFRAAVDGPLWLTPSSASRELGNLEQHTQAQRGKPWQQSGAPLEITSLHGRSLGLELVAEHTLDVTGYDAAYGDGAAQAALKSLWTTGDVRSDVITKLHHDHLEAELQRLEQEGIDCAPHKEHVTALAILEFQLWPMVAPTDLPPTPPGITGPNAYVAWARAESRTHARDAQPDKQFGVLLRLLRRNSDTQLRLEDEMFAARLLATREELCPRELSTVAP